VVNELFVAVMKKLGWGDVTPGEFHDLEAIFVAAGAVADPVAP
jgi:hypothetical protein